MRTGSEAEKPGVTYGKKESGGPGAAGGGSAGMTVLATYMNIGAPAVTLLNPTVYTPFNINYTVPADRLRLGSVLRVRAFGPIGLNTTGFVGFQIKLGTVRFGECQSITTITTGQSRWDLTAELTIAKTFAGFQSTMSVVMGQIGMPSQTAAIQDASASAGGVTFAAANLIEILAKCFVNDPLNQIGMDGFVVELGQPETIV